MPPLTHEEFSSYVKAIAASTPCVQSIWLFGSRANGTSTTSSDYDILVFGNPLTFGTLRFNTELHRSNVDLLVVTDGNLFSNAWGAKVKSGSLLRWEWKTTSEMQSCYVEHKWVENKESADILSACRHAIKVWPAL